MKRKKHPPAPEWLPQAHGAWAMLLLPFLVGLSWHEGQPPNYVWPLLPAWLFGYFAHNALVMLLRTPKDHPRRRRFWRPMAVYGGLAGAFAALVLSLNLSSALWLPLFVPFFALNLWRASLGDDVSLLARGSAAAAACMVFVVVAFPVPVPLPSDASIALASLLMYFLGAVFYVKTMIRERGQPQALRRSLGWHGACVLVTLLIAAMTQKTAALPLFFLMAFARAAIMPTAERRFGFRPQPKHVGLVEIVYVFSLLAVLWGRPS